MPKAPKFKNKDFWQFWLHGIRAVRLAEWLYDDASLFMDRKWKKAEPFIRPKLMRANMGTDGAHKISNLTGQKIGLLTVIERDMGVDGKGTEKKWICACDCGITLSVKHSRLNKQSVYSCGHLGRTKEREQIAAGRAMNVARMRVA